jgi:ribosome biogenesis GTPase A
MEEKNKPENSLSAVNWYPGHMAKARRQMQQQIFHVDMVLELRDARIPQSSENPLLKEVIGNKPRYVILAKKDLAEEAITKRWLAWLKDQGVEGCALDLIHDNVASVITEACRTTMRAKIEKLQAKGMKNVEVRAMVVGIPNVGKSTLINRLSKKKVAAAADHPGVTRSLQWIRVSPEVALLDTPGVLWPKFENRLTGFQLALCGSISSDVLPIGEVARYGIGYLLQHDPQILEEKYHITVGAGVQQTLEAITRSRQLKDAQGQWDVVRGEELVFHDFRSGQIGRVSWEAPDEDAQ